MVQSDWEVLVIAKPSSPWPVAPWPPRKESERSEARHGSAPARLAPPEPEPAVEVATLELAVVLVVLAELVAAGATPPSALLELVVGWEIAAAGWDPPELLEAVEPPHPARPIVTIAASAIGRIRISTCSLAASPDPALIAARIGPPTATIVPVSRRGGSVGLGTDRGRAAAIPIRPA